MADHAPSETRASPYHTIEGRDYHRIHGLERNFTAPRHLYFESNLELDRRFDRAGIAIRKAEWLTTNAFRNTLYAEPVRQLTTIGELSLLIEFRGKMTVELTCATPHGPSRTLAREFVAASRRSRRIIDIGPVASLPENSRIFWRIESRDDNSCLYEADFVTPSIPKRSGRLAVLIRTFGRSADVRNLLKGFDAAAGADRFYGSILEKVDFFVLDTSPDAAHRSAEWWRCGLNLKVWASANLGGGGNAGHVLKLFLDHGRQADDPTRELLILDDDLTITAETLARYYMSRLYGSGEIICSLPILTKSQPDSIWEDGGFWGHSGQHDQEAGPVRRDLFPRLVKHGKRLRGTAALDDLSSLTHCEYATFIFLGLSLETFNKIGFPASFFLRGDDVEYCLRAHRHGIGVVTNANLAAWHEPTHSYAAEYMALLHGVIINLNYDAQGARNFTKFFEQRMFEHMSIDDLVGMSVYQAILRELVNPDSLVLTENFREHYATTLPPLASIEMHPVSTLDIPLDDTEERARKRLIVPFLYPGYRGNAAKYEQVIAVNHKAKLYREIRPARAAQKTSLMRDYVNLLEQLDVRFDEIRAQWVERLRRVGTESYWEAIADKYRDSTRLIGTSSRGLPAARAVSERPEQCADVATASAGASRPEARAVNRLAWPSPFGAVTHRLRRALTIRVLPKDFDPAVYLALNRDAAATRLSASEHYLKFGRRENRAYKWRKPRRIASRRHRLASIQAICRDLPGHLYTMVSCGLRFSKWGRGSIPKDFDGAVYLEINPDVADAGADPKAHYLAFGRREGRPYRWADC